jgi:hypothetical protein
MRNAQRLLRSGANSSNGFAIRTSGISTCVRMRFRTF